MVFKGINCRWIRLCFYGWIVLLGSHALAMEWSERSFDLGDGGSVQYVVISAPLSSVVRVMVPARGLGSKAEYFSSQNQVRGVSGTVSIATIETAAASDYVASLPPGPVAVISGGLSSSDLSRPAGLVIANGELVRQLNLSQQSDRFASQAGRACPTQRRYRWSGIFCSKPNDSKILITDELENSNFSELDDCRDAIQSVPLIVEPISKNGICEDEPTRISSLGKSPAPEPRSVVCITPSELKLIVTGPTHLYPLAKHLISSENCTSALNLSGSVQAGLGYRAAKEAKWSWWPKSDRERPPLSSILILSERSTTPLARPLKK